jgi:hypothetical protein
VGEGSEVHTIRMVMLPKRGWEAGLGGRKGAF